MTESTLNRALTEAQSDILNYWASLGPESTGLYPARGAFDPGAVLKYLRDITVLELAETGEVTCRVESASQKLRLPKEALRGLQSLGLTDLLDQQAPVSGQRRVEHGTHFWMRLPMQSDDGQRLMILCHDEYVVERTNGRRDSSRVQRFSTPQVSLAA